MKPMPNPSTRLARDRPLPAAVALALLVVSPATVGAVEFPQVDDPSLPLDAGSSDPTQAPCRICFESIRGTTPFDGGAAKEITPCGGEEPGRSVNVLSGDFLVRFTVLHVEAGRGFDLRFNLTHRANFFHGGHKDLSPRWDFNYGRHLTPVPVGSDLTHYNGDGRHDVYEWNGTTKAWHGPPGFYDVIVPAGTGYELRKPHGTVERYDADGRLAEIVDRNGNAMRFGYDGDGRLSTILDTHNRNTTLTYGSGPGGRLEVIEDFLGRRVELAYDGSRLLNITTPGGAVTAFGYDALDRLVNITDPKGHTYLENEYDEYNGIDRVVRQRYGRFNYTFSYDYDDTTTRVTDRNGNVVEWHYESLERQVPTKKIVYANRNVRPGEPGAYVTEYEHNGELERVSELKPFGDRLVREFDQANPDPRSRGNLLRMTHVPTPAQVQDPSGGEEGPLAEALKAYHLAAEEAGGTAGMSIHPAPAATTTFTYEPDFNLVKTRTDPRGNLHGYEPPNGGDATPERYTTTYTYDYEEASLGDVNGDGVTTQSGGNVVRIEHPTINPAGAPEGASWKYANQKVEEFFTYNDHGQLLNRTDPMGYIEKREYYASNGNGQDPSDREGYISKVIRDYGTGVDPATGKPHVNAEETFDYDWAGNLASYTDGRGNTKSLAVNDRCLVTSITGAYETQVTYDANDNVERVARQADLGSSTFAATEVLEYDILDNPLAVMQDARRDFPTPVSKQPEKLYVNYSYDRNDNRVLTRYPASMNESEIHNVESLVYDERDLVYTKTRGGVTAQFISLAAHDHIDLEGVDATDEMATVERHYGPNGKLAREVDARGNPTRYGYDGLNRRVVTVDALGNRFVDTFDVVGNKIRSRVLGLVLGDLPVDEALPVPDLPVGLPDPEASGKPTVEYLLLSDKRFHHDELNHMYREDALFFDVERQTRLEDGPFIQGDDLVTTLTEFDAGGRATRRVNDNANSVFMDHDGLGRVIRETDALGNVKEYDHDDNGNVINLTETERSPDGILPDKVYVTRKSYDSENRLVSETDPAGHVTSYAYDGRGNLVRVVDPVGNEKRYVYDLADRKWAEHHEEGVSTYFEHDANGRLLNRTDGLGNETRYAYDHLDRKVEELYADGTRHVFTLDKNGNVRREVDPNGNEITHRYDALNRRYLTEVEPAAGVVGTLTQTFQHDGLSRIVKTTDDNGATGGTGTTTSVVTRAYDSLGNVIREEQNGRQVEKRFDGVGNAKTLRLPDVSPASEIQMTHDALERLKRIQVMTEGEEDATIATYRYFGPSRVIERESGNGVKARYAYDADGRLVSLTHKRADGTLVAGFETGYNDADVKLGERHLHNPAMSEAYALDDLYRLKGFERGTLASTGWSVATPTSDDLWEQTWNLDEAHNWRQTGRADPFGSPPVEHRDHTVLNAIEDHSSPSGTIPFRYDANGNLLDDGVHEYKWDFKNRLKEVVRKLDGSTIARYVYDAEGRRIEKSVSNVDPEINGRTTFVYDGKRVVYEAGANVRYFHGRGLDEVLALEREGASPLASDARRFHHHNPLGSVVALTDGDGRIVEGYQYDPYGSHLTYRPGPNGEVDWGGDDVLEKDGISHEENPYLFTARRLDPETGLYHYRTRYLDPDQGRFISRDTIGIWGDEGNHGNGYAYAGSNPTRYVDPMGTYGCLKEGEQGPCASPEDYENDVLEVDLDRFISTHESRRKGKISSKKTEMGCRVGTGRGVYVEGGTAKTANSDLVYVGVGVQAIPETSCKVSGSSDEAEAGLAPSVDVGCDFGPVSGGISEGGVTGSVGASVGSGVKARSIPCNASAGGRLYADVGPMKEGFKETFRPYHNGPTPTFHMNDDRTWSVTYR